MGLGGLGAYLSATSKLFLHTINSHSSWSHSRTSSVTRRKTLCVTDSAALCGAPSTLHHLWGEASRRVSLENKFQSCMNKNRYLQMSWIGFMFFYFFFFCLLAKSVGLWEHMGKPSSKDSGKDPPVDPSVYTHTDNSQASPDITLGPYSMSLHLTSCCLVKTLELHFTNWSQITFVSYHCSHHTVTKCLTTT